MRKYKKRPEGLNPPVLTVTMNEIIVLGPNQGAETIKTVAGDDSENPEQDALSGAVFADDGAALVVMITVHAFFHALAAAPLF